MIVIHTYFYSARISCLLLLATLFLACQQDATEQAEAPSPAKELSFQAVKIADSLTLIWAHCPADITGDGIVDVVFVNNNGHGGTLEFLTGQTDEGNWVRTVIAAEAPSGGTFAQGDLECADMDADGDLDIVAVGHPGEWDESTANSQIYWFENPSWEAHRIGETPDFIKDMSLVDLNKDKKMDMVALTFESSSLTIFQQNGADDWKQAQQYSGYKNLHEGMHVGDVDGDGWTDIVADAHIFYNPKGDLAAAWGEENLDTKWNTQTGDWSRNGSKVFLRDINGDQQAEIFMSHSERSGYPLSMYQRAADGSWTEHVIADSIPACHTLQVFDFDQDGDFDVLAGINKSRAQGLEFSSFEVNIFLSENDYRAWTPFLLEREGIYNGQAADLEQDGDYDVFRYQTHDARELYVYKNTISDATAN